MIFLRKIIFFVSDGACLLPTKAGDNQIEINEHTDIETKTLTGLQTMLFHWHCQRKNIFCIKPKTPLSYSNKKSTPECAFLFFTCLLLDTELLADFLRNSILVNNDIHCLITCKGL